MVRAVLLSFACVGLALSATAVAGRGDRGQAIAYGEAPLQAMDYWPGASAVAPLVVFVHGGGWVEGDKGQVRAKLPTLLAEGLVDEYRLCISPVLLGRGNPLFKTSDAQTKLDLVEARGLANGGVLLTYRPNPA